MKKQFLRTLEECIKLMVIYEDTGLHPFKRLWVQQKAVFVKVQDEAKDIELTGEEIAQAMEKGRKVAKHITMAYIDYIGHVAGMDDDDYAEFMASHSDTVKMWQGFEAGRL